jgi:hypothetical protein
MVRALGFWAGLGMKGFTWSLKGGLWMYGDLDAASVSTLHSIQFLALALWLSLEEGP